MDVITNFKQDYELLDYEKNISNKDKELRFNEPEDTYAYQCMMNHFIQPLLEENPHMSFHYFNVVNDRVYAHLNVAGDDIHAYFMPLEGNIKIELENDMTGEDIVKDLKIEPILHDNSFHYFKNK